MEVKSAAWATVALVITAFGGVVIYAIEREASKSDLSKARKELSAMETMVDTRKRTLTERQETLATTQDRVVGITSAMTRIQSTLEANAALQSKVDGLRTGWGKTLAAFRKDVDLVRQRTRDEVTPEMVLADGNSLKTVRFKDLKDTTVILEHGAGIAKVPLANMPADWIGRLALGWNPKLPSALSGKADEPEAVAAVAAPMKTVEMAQQEHRESVKRADVTDAAAKIKSLERRIVEARKAHMVQSRIADEYQTKLNLAQLKGNSSSHGVKRDEARRAMAALDNQVNAAQDQIQKLYDEIRQKTQ